jgi:integrase
MKRRNNGAGHIRQKPDGRWEALYYVSGERRYITGRKGENAADVQRRLNEALHNLDRGIETPKDNRQTVGEYLEAWLAVKKPTVEFSYWKRCETVIRVYVKPALGRIHLTKLTAQQIEQLYAQVIAMGKAPNTVAKVHIALHKALEDALRKDLVVRNVADLVSKPKVPHIEMQTYTPEEAAQLLDAAQGDRLEALYVLMLTSACRLGELLGLRWPALDLDRGEMQITSAMKDVGGHLTLGKPKTAHSRRTIPLTNRAVEALRQHHVAQTLERLKRGGGWNPHKLVFVTSHGTAYSQTNFHKQQYKPMLAKAGLSYIRPHDLRHTAATLLLREGVQPHVVSEMLGHASVAFTLQTYGHVQTEMRKPARDAMERLFGANPEKLASS